MKKIIKTCWQLLIMPVMFLPYHILNTKLLVDWLGCGCPKLDEQGNEIISSFNANDFTLIFWIVAAVVVIIISLFNMRNLAKWYSKLAYILLIAGGSVFLAFKFHTLMQWR